eukprot:CAMPEP_0115300998 /NCGR_PEP_ID=MMETSP0270-20121206/69627_1 /TAXON_ID=71861 /ORGANISM="Scrippsiella trochoidea, Strain CCMP3099" /LENGTH=250 /DNA_ID=CAMNT_0002718853 /DNA_START=37 /DNA_END=786 /DNA_ORIENTATION=-
MAQMRSSCISSKPSGVNSAQRCVRLPCGVTRHGVALVPAATSTALAALSAIVVNIVDFLDCRVQILQDLQRVLHLAVDVLRTGPAVRGRSDCCRGAVLRSAPRPLHDVCHLLDLGLQPAHLHPLDLPLHPRAEARVQDAHQTRGNGGHCKGPSSQVAVGQSTQEATNKEGCEDDEQHSQFLQVHLQLNFLQVAAPPASHAARTTIIVALPNVEPMSVAVPVTCVVRTTAPRCMVHIAFCIPLAHAAEQAA